MGFPWAFIVWGRYAFALVGERRIEALLAPLMGIFNFEPARINLALLNRLNATIARTDVWYFLAIPDKVSPLLTL